MCTEKEEKAQYCVEQILTNHSEHNLGEAWKYWCELYDLYDNPADLKKLLFFTNQIDDKTVYDVTDYGKMLFSNRQDYLYEGNDTMNYYDLYCRTADNKSFYLCCDGEMLLCVDDTLSVEDKVAYMKKAMNNNIDSEDEKAYIFATSIDNRERLEDLWQEYKDDEDFFLQISDEFESGFEQYCEEIGTDLEL